MEAVCAVHELFSSCRAAASPRVSVHAVEALVKHHLLQTAALDEQELESVVRQAFPDADPRGKIDFLSFWKGMEALLASLGMQDATVAEDRHLQGLQFFRDRVLTVAQTRARGQGAAREAKSRAGDRRRAESLAPVSAVVLTKQEIVEVVRETGSRLSRFPHERRKENPDFNRDEIGQETEPFWDQVYADASRVDDGAGVSIGDLSAMVFDFLHAYLNSRHERRGDEIESEAESERDRRRQRNPQQGEEEWRQDAGSGAATPSGLTSGRRDERDREEQKAEDQQEADEEEQGDEEHDQEEHDDEERDDAEEGKGGVGRTGREAISGVMQSRYANRHRRVHTEISEGEEEPAGEYDQSGEYETDNQGGERAKMLCSARLGSQLHRDVFPRSQPGNGDGRGREADEEMAYIPETEEFRSPTFGREEYLRGEIARGRARRMPAATELTCKGADSAGSGDSEEAGVGRQVESDPDRGDTDPQREAKPASRRRAARSLLTSRDPNFLGEPPWDEAPGEQEEDEAGEGEGEEREEDEDEGGEERVDEGEEEREEEEERVDEGEEEREEEEERVDEGEEERAEEREEEGEGQDIERQVQDEGDRDMQEDEGEEASDREGGDNGGTIAYGPSCFRQHFEESADESGGETEGNSWRAFAARLDAALRRLQETCAVPRVGATRAERASQLRKSQRCVAEALDAFEGLERQAVQNEEELRMVERSTSRLRREKFQLLERLQRLETKVEDLPEDGTELENLRARLLFFQDQTEMQKRQLRDKEDLLRKTTEERDSLQEETASLQRWCTKKVEEITRDTQLRLQQREEELRTLQGEKAALEEELRSAAERQRLSQAVTAAAETPATDMRRISDASQDGDSARALRARLRELQDLRDCVELEVEAKDALIHRLQRQTEESQQKILELDVKLRQASGLVLQLRRVRDDLLKAHEKWRAEATRDREKLVKVFQVAASPPSSTGRREGSASPQNARSPTSLTDAVISSAEERMTLLQKDQEIHRLRDTLASAQGHIRQLEQFIDGMRRERQAAHPASKLAVGPDFSLGRRAGSPVSLASSLSSDLSLNSRQTPSRARRDAAHARRGGAREKPENGDRDSPDARPASLRDELAQGPANREWQCREERRDEEREDECADNGRRGVEDGRCRRRVGAEGTPSERGRCVETVGEGDAKREANDGSEARSSRETPASSGSLPEAESKIYAFKSCDDELGDAQQPSVSSSSTATSRSLLFSVEKFGTVGESSLPSPPGEEPRFAGPSGALDEETRPTAATRQRPTGEPRRLSIDTCIRNLSEQVEETEARDKTRLEAKQRNGEEGSGEEDDAGEGEGGGDGRGEKEEINGEEKEGMMDASTLKEDALTVPSASQSLTHETLRALEQEEGEEEFEKRKKRKSRPRREGWDLSQSGSNSSYTSFLVDVSVAGSGDEDSASLRHRATPSSPAVSRRSQWTHGSCHTPRHREKARRREKKVIRSREAVGEPDSASTGRLPHAREGSRKASVVSQTSNVSGKDEPGARGEARGKDVPFLAARLRRKLTVEKREKERRAADGEDEGSSPRRLSKARRPEELSLDSSARLGLAGKDGMRPERREKEQAFSPKAGQGEAEERHRRLRSAAAEEASKKRREAGERLKKAGDPEDDKISMRSMPSEWRTERLDSNRSSMKSFEFVSFHSRLSFPSLPGLGTRAPPFAAGAARPPHLSSASTVSGTSSGRGERRTLALPRSLASPSSFHGTNAENSQEREHASALSRQDNSLVPGKPADFFLDSPRANSATLRLSPVDSRSLSGDFLGRPSSASEVAFGDTQLSFGAGRGASASLATAPGPPHSATSSTSVASSSPPLSPPATKTTAHYLAETRDGAGALPAVSEPGGPRDSSRAWPSPLRAKSRQELSSKAAARSETEPWGKGGIPISSAPQTSSTLEEEEGEDREALAARETSFTLYSPSNSAEERLSPSPSSPALANLDGDHPTPQHERGDRHGARTRSRGVDSEEEQSVAASPAFASGRRNLSLKRQTRDKKDLRSPGQPRVLQPLVPVGLVRRPASSSSRAASLKTRKMKRETGNEERKENATADLSAENTSPSSSASVSFSLSASLRALSSAFGASPVADVESPEGTGDAKAKTEVPGRGKRAVLRNEARETVDGTQGQKREIGKLRSNSSLVTAEKGDASVAGNPGSEEKARRLVGLFSRQGAGGEKTSSASFGEEMEKRREDADDEARDEQERRRGPRSSVGASAFALLSSELQRQDTEEKERKEKEHGRTQAGEGRSGRRGSLSRAQDAGVRSSQGSEARNAQTQKAGDHEAQRRLRRTVSSLSSLSNPEIAARTLARGHRLFLGRAEEREEGRKTGEDDREGEGTASGKSARSPAREREDRQRPEFFSKRSSSQDEGGPSVAVSRTLTMTRAANPRARPTREPSERKSDGAAEGKHRENSTRKRSSASSSTRHSSFASSLPSSLYSSLWGNLGEGTDVKEKVTERVAALEGGAFEAGKSSFFFAETTAEKRADSSTAKTRQAHASLPVSSSLPLRRLALDKEENLFSPSTAAPS